MIKAIKLTVIAAMSVAVFACSVDGNSITSENSTADGSNNTESAFKTHVMPKICSNEWFTKVDSQVITGDGQGHGPDLGSLEWRSVVEFKLGIRGDLSVPARDSEQWCDYINAEFIK